MDKTDIRIPTDEELTAYMEESAVVQTELMNSHRLY